ncbi:MAG: hypothetical protein K2X35_03090 [Bryobacteraceae bacterium]|nr:hypothetical protein [Bryobacteraceae bacterium]
MFDSLDAQMEKTGLEPSKRDRAVRWVIYVAAAVIVFAGMYFGLSSLEGN